LRVGENELTPPAFFALTRQKYELQPSSESRVFDVSVNVESENTLFEGSVNVESVETCKKYDAGLLVEVFQIHTGVRVLTVSLFKGVTRAGVDGAAIAVVKLRMAEVSARLPLNEATFQ
jgi:hypothetical protein